MKEEPFRLDGFQELRLEDRDAITAFLLRHPPEISELTFTNLFMWNPKNRLAWRVLDQTLYLLAAPVAGAAPYLLPPVGPRLEVQAVERLLQAMQSAGKQGRMERVPARMAEQLQADLPGLTAEPDRDNADYVYSREALATLAGRKFSRKRNHIKRFTERNEWTYLACNPTMIQQCLDLQEHWCALKHCEEFPNTAAEHRAIEIAFRHAGALLFSGAAIAVAGKIQAFTLGELLSPDTAVIHIEKANPEIDGLYPTLTHEYVKNAWAGVSWINREQDVGEPGLRQAKESFFPDHLVEKYTLTFP
jgi:uncharacterized protein